MPDQKEPTFDIPPPQSAPRPLDRPVTLGEVQLSLELLERIEAKVKAAIRTDLEAVLIASVKGAVVSEFRKSGVVEQEVAAEVRAKRNSLTGVVSVVVAVLGLAGFKFLESLIVPTVEAEIAAEMSQNHASLKKLESRILTVRDRTSESNNRLLQEMNKASIVTLNEFNVAVGEQRRKALQQIETASGDASTKVQLDAKNAQARSETIANESVERAKQAASSATDLIKGRSDSLMATLKLKEDEFSTATGRMNAKLVATISAGERTISDAKDRALTALARSVTSTSDTGSAEDDGGGSSTGLTSVEAAAQVFSLISERDYDALASFTTLLIDDFPDVAFASLAIILNVEPDHKKALVALEQALSDRFGLLQRVKIVTEAALSAIERKDPDFSERVVLELKNNAVARQAQTAFDKLAFMIMNGEVEEVTLSDMFRSIDFDNLTPVGLLNALWLGRQAGLEPESLASLHTRVHDSLAESMNNPSDYLFIGRFLNAVASEPIINHVEAAWMLGHVREVVFIEGADALDPSGYAILLDQAAERIK